MDRRVFTIIIIAVVVIFFLNPFGRNRNRETYFPPGVRSETLEPLIGYLQTEAEDPVTYVASLFLDHDIVFLGELQRIKQQVEFVGELIPALYSRGVRNLAIEYALYEDQQRIDELVTATVFDEKLAERILFDFFALWGFQEYVDLFRSAWEVNRRRPDGEPPFRIVGLNVRRDYTQMQDQRSLEDPEILAKVFAWGHPEAHYAEVITREFVEKDEKALILTGIKSSVTRYRDLGYAEDAKEKGLVETRQGGNIIYDTVGERAVRVLLHSPWPDIRRLRPLYYPLDGVFDRALLELPEDGRRLGFDLAGPAGALPVSGDMAEGYDDLTLGEYADGYVVLGPISDYTPVSPIPDFFSEANRREVIDGYPALFRTGEEPSVTELNNLTAQDVEQLQKNLDQFR
jgi:hypothetical protein